MNDGSSSPVTSGLDTVNAPDAAFFAHPDQVLQAAGDAARWIALRELAAGDVLDLQTLAARAGRTPNQMGKHLAVLREAGLVVAAASPDGDGRKQCHAVPEAFRRVDEAGRVTLDYGVCVLRFSAATNVTGKIPKD